MKKFIDNNDTVIEYGFNPVYEDSKKVEVETGIFKHKGYLKNVYYHQKIYDNVGDTGKTRKIWLDINHLKQIIEAVEEIQNTEINMELEDTLPW